MELLKIRRVFTVCAGILGSGCTVAFGLAREPLTATLCFCGTIASHCLHHSAQQPQPRELSLASG